MCRMPDSITRANDRINPAGISTPTEWGAIRSEVELREERHATRRKHVEHFISTLDDRDLAKQLTILQLSDAEDREETLRAYQRMETSTRRRR